jgi:TonB family protein
MIGLGWLCWWAMQVAPGIALLPPVLESVADPIYPPDAHDEGVGGVVVMDVQIATDGGVSWVGVRSSPDVRLSWSAMGALTQARFYPARQLHPDGHEDPIVVQVSYEMTFVADAHDDHIEPPPPTPVASTAPIAPPAQAETSVRARRVRHVDIATEVTQASDTMGRAQLAAVRGRSLAVDVSLCSTMVFATRGKIGVSIMRLRSMPRPQGRSPL